MNKEGVEKKSEDIGVNGQKSSKEKREEDRKRAEEAEIRILERIRLREMAEEEKKLNFILALINTANPSPLSLHQAEFFFNIAKQISKGSQKQPPFIRH